MAERRRWLAFLSYGLLAAVLAWAGWGLWHDRALAERFELVHLGMDRKAAEAALGKPDREGACGSWAGTLPRADCALELGYSSTFALLSGRHYLVQLDRSGRVIEAESVSSGSLLSRVTG